jgi:probable phosphoglycerate mutase
MKLLWTRHGQSYRQTEGESAGTNAPLTQLGELQAHRLGKYLRRYEAVDRIVASDLQRARVTAEIVAGYIDLPVQIEEGLREFESWAEGSAPTPRSLWDPTPGAAVNPEHLAFRKRVRNTLQDLLNDSPPAEKTLLVAHGGTVGTALRVLLGAMTPHLWTANTALHSLRWTGEFWLIHYINCLEHLPRPLRSW